MRIIGCDFHPRYQQIAMMDTETGELVERRLEHANGEARSFYASLPKPVLVGMEATGHAQWFERMLAEQEVHKLQVPWTDSRTPFLRLGLEVEQREGGVWVWCLPEHQSSHRNTGTPRRRTRLLRSITLLSISSRPCISSRTFIIFSSPTIYP